MPNAGDIYRCEKVPGDPSSGHWWVLVYVGVDEVLYITTTSKVGLFTYERGLRESERQPFSVVFIDMNEVVDKGGSPIFKKPTILKCYHPPTDILFSDFDRRVEGSQLKKEGKLPDHYLAQIVPSAICSGTWSSDTTKQVLHTAHGIGGRVDAFYRALR